MRFLPPAMICTRTPLRQNSCRQTSPGKGGGTPPAVPQFAVLQRGVAMFLFFSNRLGLLSSIAISAVLTLLLLSFCNVT
jgi:hypothetical protein